MFCLNIPDIYDTDDDNDSIPTSVEVQNHLDPFNPADANGDLDHDGLTNLFEYDNKLNIQDADTDHDGINDGAEYHCWQNRLYSLWGGWVNSTTGKKVNDTAISYCKIPDVDHDNITDGKEIKGYKVKIIVGWKSDGTPVSRMRFISPKELDPLIPYTNSTGVLLDTDKDGIPDVVESWFSNVSIVKSESYRRAFKSKFGTELFNRYAWVISYFWTVYWKDYDEHHNSTSAMQNATNWLRDQFNPMIVDHTPPVITKFDLSWDVEGSWWPPSVSVYAVVHLAIHDVGGITSFTIYDWDNGERYTPDNLGETSYEVWQWFDVSAFTAAFGSVKIGVYAQDSAGNSIYVEKELKGALQSVIDALAKLWDAIWSALQKVAQAIMSALNVLWNWIKKIIEQLVNFILSPIMNMINSFKNSMITAIDNIYAETGFEPDKITTKHLETINSLMLPLWMLGIGIGVGFLALSMFITGITFGVGSLLATAISYVAYVIVTAVVGSMISEKYSLGISQPIGIQAILQLMKNILHIDGERVNRDEIPPGEWAFFSVLAGWGSFILGLAAYGLATEDSTGSTAAVLSIVANIFAFIFATIAMPLTKPYRVDFFGLCGLFFGIEGVVFGLMSLKGGNIGVWIIGVIGAALGGLAIYFSLKAMEVV